MAEGYFAPVERTLSEWNLNTPGKRMLVGGTLGLLAVWAIQPKVMFHKGKPRPFVAWTNKTEDGVTPTSTPWWLAVVGGAFVLGMLI